MDKNIEGTGRSRGMVEAQTVVRSTKDAILLGLWVLAYGVLVLVFQGLKRLEPTPRGPAAGLRKPS